MTIVGNGLEQIEVDQHQRTFPTALYQIEEESGISSSGQGNNSWMIYQGLNHILFHSFLGMVLIAREDSWQEERPAKIYSLVVDSLHRRL